MMISDSGLLFWATLYVIYYLPLHQNDGIGKICLCLYYLSLSFSLQKKTVHYIRGFFTQNLQFYMNLRGCEIISHS